MVVPGSFFVDVEDWTLHFDLVGWMLFVTPATTEQAFFGTYVFLNIGVLLSPTSSEHHLFFFAISFVLCLGRGIAHRVAL